MPLSAAISTTTSGQTAVVAAVTGRKIKVLGYVLMAAGTVNVKWQDGTTDLTGALPLTAQVGAVVPQCGGEGYHPEWFKTTAGNALNLNCDSTVGVYGQVVYELE
jgi:hypothetical protein